MDMWSAFLLPPQAVSLPVRTDSCKSIRNRKYSFVGPLSSLGKKNHRKHLHCTHPFSAPQMLFGSLSSCLLPISLLRPLAFLLAGDIRNGVSHTPLHLGCCLQGSFYQIHALKCYLEIRSGVRLPYCIFWPSRLELQMES